MADGNLGSLWFQLGLKDNTSKELQKIIDKLKTGDDAANALLRALQGFGTKKSGFKEQAEKAKEFSDVLLELNRRISKLRKNDKGDEAKDLQAAVKNALSYLDMLQKINIERSKISELRSLNPNVDTSKLREAEVMLENVNSQLLRLQGKPQGGGGGGVDRANVLQDYSKVLQMTLRDVKQITDQFKKENPLSAFSGGAVKVEADIARVTEKLAKMRDIMSEGVTKGYNTSMLGGSLVELDKVLSRLQAASGNKSILTDAAQMKNLFSDVAVEMAKATSATQAYGREKGKVIAVEREFAAASKLSAKDNEAELKAQSDYIKRYMALVEKKREMAEKGGITLFQKNDQGLKNITAEIDVLLNKLAKVREDITLYQHAIGSGTKDSIAFGQQGLKEANAEAEKLMSTITALQSVYDTLRVSQANVKDLIGQTPQKQRQDDIQKRMSEYYSNLEKTSAKEAAQATREAVKAKREDIQAEKQRQNEIEITKRRIQSLSYAMRNLQVKVNEGQAVNVDTSKAEAKIKKLEGEISVLRDLQSKLEGSGWKGYLGSLGQFGNGRSVREANHLAQEQAAVNREAQKGIGIEQKRQAEIAKSAAKVQSDLVRGFERANNRAGKLNSTIQDLKSLFLQGGLVFGAQQFAMSIITTGGEMEKQHIALQSILGDMQNANTMFNQIKELALNSPFTFSELNRDVKQLAAYGVEYDQLYDTTKRLADMSSGLGVSFDRIALAFGQVQARGWLDGKELRQIAYAGIPLLDKLSKFYSKQEGRNVSTSEIKTRISNREVSFDDVKSIFWQMTNEGGQFYNMQQTLSETLLGRYNKLKDAWEIMLSEFASGESLVGSFFKTALDGATALVQALHTLAMPVGTIFAGYALRKMLAGNTASSFLSNKANIASNIESRVLQGQQISQIEQRILATKNQITGADLRALANARALTTEKLNQLRLSGQITAEQYNTYRGIVLRQTGEAGVLARLKLTLASMRQITAASAWASLKSVWPSFATSALASFRIIGTGIKTMASTVWATIGGLPGLIVTALTLGITSAISSYQELSQKIKQTQDEISDKNNQIAKFLQDNNVTVAIASGDTKEIDNMIDSYKDKLKELAPYNYKNMLMSAEEKKSHVERLKYLEQEIKLLKEANDVAKSKMNNRGYYSDLEDVTKDTYEKLENRLEMKAAATMPNASQGDKDLYTNEKAYEDYIDKLKDKLAEKFGDIGNDEKMREAAMQSMNALFSEMGVPEDRAEMIRASVLQAFGCGDKSAWLQSEVSNSMIGLIDKAFPMIGEKIKASIPLNDAEKKKVRELMEDAKNGLVKQYPELEQTLKQMLAASNFKAVIRLVFDGGEKLNDVQRTLVGRIPSMIDPNSSLGAKYRGRAHEYGKDNNWYKGRNAAQTRIDDANDNYINAKKSKAPNIAKLYQDYLDERRIAETLLYYDYSGAGKKSNKPGKKNTGGRKEDVALKALQERVRLYEKLYSEYRKYKDLYGNGALGQLANDGEFAPIFDKKNRRLYPISDYTNYETSIKEMLRVVPATTRERRAYKESKTADIAGKNRELVQQQRSDEISALNEQLNIIQEQYDIYKKIYELTGNKKGAENVAFGGSVQFDSNKKFLNEQLDIAVKHDNVQSGLNLSTEEVRGLDLNNVKDKYGKESRTYDIKKRLDDENKKIKSETINLLADLIEKNATIGQQIEDENRKYERQLDLIKEIEDPQMRQRAREGAEKTHNETSAKLQFEQFKQESDWVTIFDDLDRVSSATIDSMVNRIDEFSRTTGISVEIVKQLRDALSKLRDEQIERNPFKDIFGGNHRGNAIGSFIRSRFNNGMDASATTDVSDAQARKFGIGKGGKFTRGQLEGFQRSAYNDSSKAISSLSNKMQALSTVMDPVVNLFQAMGETDSILGQITSGATGALSSAAGTAGAFETLGKMKGLGFLSSASPYAAAASAALSIGGSLVKAFGADYSDYNKAKAEYDNLINVWDTLISKKKQYLSENWGTEAQNASKEAMALLQSEIEQTKVIARSRLDSGASAGSHSIDYRMWKGSYKYNGQNWQDVAGEISSKYGVQFNGMEDLLDMAPDVLEKIQTDYSGLWAVMDGDFRDYLNKLIEYGDQADELTESITEKLTGNKFSDLVSSWGDAMSSMANSSDNLVDNFEENLKKSILNSMIQEIYGDKIKAIIAKTKKYAENDDKITDSSGNIISNYTEAEYADIMGSTDDLAKQIEGTRDFLKKTYGWSDNSSSSSTNSVKGITEETADILVSYCNAMRLDLSVLRAEQAKYLPEMSEIAKSQLSQLNMIAQNTLRNADAAERIENIFIEYNDNFNRVLNGTKSLKMK